MKRLLKPIVVPLFGVILPLIALLFELMSKQCAETFFDPIPSSAHVALVASVAIGNLAVWLRVRHAKTAVEARYALLNAIVVGIALYYSAIFLPLVPTGIIGLVVLVGLLPLSPLLALGVACALRREIVRNARTSGVVKPPFWKHMAFGFCVLLTLEIPAISTQVGLQMANSADSQTELRGIKLLRALGAEQHLLRACFNRSEHMVDLIRVALNSYQPVPVERAREIYYRVTGHPYTDQERPGTGGLIDFDAHLGAKHVGQAVRSVELSSSELDVAIEAQVAAAQMDWTAEIRNVGDRLAEARLQLALPPQAVVSGVWLWIDGEEQPAVFAARQQARDAYTRVVERRRDPILVTSSGPDAVFVQLFPIPPRGGTMRFRLRISAPLDIHGTDRAALLLPSIRERNFKYAAEIKHQVTVHGDQTLFSPNPNFEMVPSGGSRTTLNARFALPLTAPVSVFTSRDASAANRTSKDPEIVGTRGIGTTQPIDSRIEQLWVVIDTSSPLQHYRQTLFAILAKLHANLDLSVVIAADETSPPFTPSSSTDLSRFVADLEFQGGIDNSPALLRARGFARNADRSAVLWLHGPQVSGPRGVVRSGSVNGAARTIPLYALQLVPGPNLLKARFESIPGFLVLPLYTTAADTVDRYLAYWTGKRVALRPVLKPLNAGAASTNTTSDALVQALRANRRIRALLAAGSAEAHAEAEQLALTHRLVTPVTGAVVLESQADYAAAGLTPSNGASVPAVPEPEMWLLMLCAVLGLSAVHARLSTRKRESW